MTSSSKRCLRTDLYPRFLIFFLVTMLPSALGAVDTSLAVVISTNLNQSYFPTLFFIYGNPDVYLPELISNATSATSFSTNAIRRSISISSVPNSGPVEVDYKRSALWWIFEFQKSIASFPWILTDSSNNKEYDSSAAPLSSQVTGLSLDWVSNLLYWSDAGNQRIGVIDTINFTYWKIVVATNLSSPQDVVVYPPQSYLYWSDAGSTPKIEMLDLTKNNRKVLVSSPTVQSPKTLVIDYASLRLYWLDTAKTEVSSVNLDGSGYVPWKSTLFSQISSFFIYKQYFAFADQSNFIVYFFNGTQSIYNYTHSDVWGIYDIMMFEPTRQPSVTSPCTSNNGGCKQVCITLSATSRQCQCADGTSWCVPSGGSSDVVKGGKWTMTILCAVLVFVQIRFSATK